MPINKFLTTILKRRPQLMLFSGLSVVLFISTVTLTFQVFYTLEDYRSTRTGNILWATTQLEVDHLKLSNAFMHLKDGDTSSASFVRRRFNSFYNRSTILQESEAYQAELAGTDALPLLEKINDAIEKMSIIIDDSDQTILQGREGLIETSASLNIPIRKLISHSIQLEAGIVERERRILTDRLLEISLLSLMLLITLLSLVTLLWRLSNLYIRRANDNRADLHRLSTILNTSQDAVLVVQKNGAIANFNSVAEQMFAITSEEGHRKTVSDILIRLSKDGIQSPISGEELFKTCETGPNRCRNFTAMTTAGHNLPVELSMGMATRGDIDICVCFISDISHHITAETEIRLAQEQALAGERTKASFLNTVSHEMRTPLHGILGALDLLNETKMDPEQQRYTRTMQTSGQLLLKQINDVLDIALHDNGQLHLKKKYF